MAALNLGCRAVHVGPDRKVLGLTVRGFIGMCASPFHEGGLDKALGLSVALWSVWSGADVFGAEFTAGIAEGEGLCSRS